MSHAEVASLVTGKTMVMPVLLGGADAEVRIRLAQDGSLSGNLHTMFGPAGVSGGWRILHSGYLCTDLNYANGVRDRRTERHGSMPSQKLVIVSFLSLASRA